MPLTCLLFVLLCYVFFVLFVFFFFFQAEDGIRDWSVTGVQTCALPISGSPKRRRCSRSTRWPGRNSAPWGSRSPASRSRSEERRVGKECRSRWSPDPEKTKKRTRRTVVTI